MTTEKAKRFEAIIRALMQKTVENGCTEQEALEAAAKAAELMERYELTLTDEQIVEEGAVRELWRPANMLEATVVSWLSRAIGRFTETKVYRAASMVSYRAKIIPLAIIGLPADVQLAKYLTQSLCAFGVAGASSASPRHRVDYMKGFCTRVSRRLNEMCAARSAARACGGRALAVIDLKRKAIDAFVETNRLRLRSRSAAQYANKGAAYYAGQARGDAATFGRPVGGSSVLLIGK